MPLVRCDYSSEHFTEDTLRQFGKIVYDVSAEVCHYSEEDAKNKISIFNTPFGPLDHSTASIEVEIRARVAEFDKPGKTREDVRREWLRAYEAGLIPFAKEVNLAAPIILTVTFADWEVMVVTSSGSTPNSPN